MVPDAKQDRATRPEAQTLRTQVLHGSRADTGGSTMASTGAAGQAQLGGATDCVMLCQRFMVVPELPSPVLIHTVSCAGQGCVAVAEVCASRLNHRQQQSGAKRLDDCRCPSHLYEGAQPSRAVLDAAASGPMPSGCHLSRQSTAAAPHHPVLASCTTPVQLQDTLALPHNTDPGQPCCCCCHLHRWSSRHRDCPVLSCQPAQLRCC
jgi:hypothetical protein